MKKINCISDSADGLIVINPYSQVTVSLPYYHQSFEK